MKILKYEGKNLDSILEEAFSDNNLTEENVIYSYHEEKSGLFKTTIIKLNMIKLEDIQTYAKEYLTDLITNMGLEISIETRIREKQIMLKLFSNNNSILIGKNGKMLSSLQTILKQALYNVIGMYPNIVLDVENYKDKQLQQLERIAKRTAYEVQKTKVDASLENMNSYERRIVHNALSNLKNIQTLSEGEEPNRYVVIKYKEE